jgi:saccharopine dehydrogenase (NAD+, L-lysine-forming)
MSTQRLWLRCEKKEFERRSALTPTTAKKLIDAGFQISVERDEQRIFDDAEFEAYVQIIYPVSSAKLASQCRLHVG